mmetsp:Transcript_11349/g.42579  ORF Transcript_11349/g.42579 Transcript_11349/m.42579 type:complete len:101 (-) Transcript_11349:1636-1938(-)
MFVCQKCGAAANCGESYSNSPGAIEMQTCWPNDLSSSSCGVDASILLDPKLTLSLNPLQTHIAAHFSQPIPLLNESWQWLSESNPNHLQISSQMTSCQIW